MCLSCSIPCRTAGAQTCQSIRQHHAQGHTTEREVEEVREGKGVGKWVREGRVGG